MDMVVYGGLEQYGIEVVSRSGRCYVRYDAGAHAVAWREDEVTEPEMKAIVSGGKAQESVMLASQLRLEKSGVNPYVSNWKSEA